MLTESQILEAVAAKCGTTEATREAALAVLLSEDEADLIVCLRREREEEELPWEEVRETFVDLREQDDSLRANGSD
jgi:hypothetical protein